MNILILGGGAREHALAWAVKQNPKCDRLCVAPGNAGIALIAECATLDINDGAQVVEFAQANAISFVIIGPEAPLEAGVSDRLREAGILCFGPSRAAAMLETSKAFTKDICAAADAPTAASARFDDLDAARAFIRGQTMPVVIKADGLAAGKGVVVAQCEAEAVSAVEAMLGGAYGAAGNEVLVEEFMRGEEASFFVLCDGEEVLPIGTARDYKRAFDGDVGPNSGGMGAVSPAPVMSEAVCERALTEIVRPCLREMARRGTPFQGLLYVGLMIADGAPRLVEFNVRFGDPECQVLMMRLGAQVLDLLLACAQGRLGEARVSWADDCAVSVVMATQGYPGEYGRGSAIGGLEGLAEDSMNMVFHGATGRVDGGFVAAGGRVLSVSARGVSAAEARRRAYGAVARIDWPDGFFRTDIGADF